MGAHGKVGGKMDFYMGRKTGKERTAHVEVLPGNVQRM